MLCANRHTMRMDHYVLEQRLTDAYDEWSDAIFRHCYFRMGNREVGKELMQEAFTKTWEYLIAGNEVENMKAFLYRTANNLIVDYLRRKSKRTETSLEEMQEQSGFDIAGDEDTKQRASRSFSEQQVTQILNKVDEPYRSTLIMRYIDELSPKEIAQSLGETANVISVRLNRGMKMLRSHLPDHG